MREQRRFIEAVERLASLINDFERLLLPELRRAMMTRPPLAVGAEQQGKPYQ